MLIYIFFFIAVLVAISSYLRIYQHEINVPSLVIRMREQREEQKMLATALVEKERLVSRKEEIVRSFAQGTKPGSGVPDQVASEMRSLDQRFNEISERMRLGQRELAAEAETKLEEKERLRRYARRAEIVFLSVSATCALALMILSILGVSP